MRHALPDILEVSSKEQQSKAGRDLQQSHSRDKPYADGKPFVPSKPFGAFKRKTRWSASEKWGCVGRCRPEISITRKPNLPERENFDRLFQLQNLGSKRFVNFFPLHIRYC